VPLCEQCAQAVSLDWHVPFVFLILLTENNPWVNHPMVFPLTEFSMSKILVSNVLMYICSGVYAFCFHEWLIDMLLTNKEVSSV